MNQRAYISAHIERNRIALLRIVFCWLGAVFAFRGAGSRHLPRRLSAWVDHLIFTAEKAAGYLLIAIFNNGQMKRTRVPAFEAFAHRHARANRTITLGERTIGGVIQRLKSLQHLLHNLHAIARRLAKAVAAKARVQAMMVLATLGARRPILKLAATFPGVIAVPP